MNSINSIEDKPIEEISWDKIVEHFYDQDLEHYDNIVKVIYKDDKMKRAIILNKPNGMHTVIYESLTPCSGSGDAEYLKKEIRTYGGCWCQVYTSIFDTLERAIEVISKGYY